MGKRERTKGHSFERRVAAWLTGMGLGTYARNVSEVQTGNTGDVKLMVTPWGGGIPLSVQAKHRASPSPWGAMEEAREGSLTGEIPMAVVRRNGGETLVVMDPEGFNALMLYVRAADKEVRF